MPSSTWSFSLSCVFSVHFLPKECQAGLTVLHPHAGVLTVTADGKKIDTWTFGPNNVLAWEDEAGHSAWLQLVKLPSGPVLVGNLYGPKDPAPERESPLTAWHSLLATPRYLPYKVHVRTHTMPQTRPLPLGSFVHTIKNVQAPASGADGFWSSTPLAKTISAACSGFRNWC